MKLHKISLALMLGFCMLTSCSDKLEVTNPNQPTTGTFGNTVDDLEEAVIACYHHIRMEGTFARVGYTLDAVRGDEVWNSAQGWGYYLADKLSPSTTDEIYALWSWRDWYYVINICNFVITKCNEEASLSTAKQRIKGQALFIRGLAYYNLAGYYQNPALILDYNEYSSLDGLYASNVSEGDASAFEQYDRVMDQVEADFAEALSLLPSKTEGGEWAKGRATKGAAQAMLVKVYMYMHNYTKAKEWGDKFLTDQAAEYSLVPNFADNFTLSGENNAESIFEIQYANEGTSDFNPGNGATRGTFTTVLTRSRSTNMGDEGWGFNKPTHNLYNEYEEADSLRRDATIILLDSAHLGDQDVYLGTSYLNRKTGLYNADGTGYTYKLAHNTRGVLNNKQIRLADFYLLYAEACLETGDNGTATIYLNKVRDRAGLAPYPGYSFKVNGVEITSPTLLSRTSPPIPSESM